ncbi:MAG: hypothetical protein WDA09_06165 [Bacteriovoracaceae bacterium]
MKWISLVALVVSFSAFSQRNVNYEYKKYEKFDFSEISVEGVAGSPGDISVSPRLRKEFQNKLPDRPNFNREMQKSLEAIR